MNTIYLIRHKDDKKLYWSPGFGWGRIYGARIYTTADVNLLVPVDGVFEQYSLLDAEEVERVKEVLEKCIHEMKMSAVRIGCDPEHGLSEEWWPSIVQAVKVLKEINDG